MTTTSDFRTTSPSTPATIGTKATLMSITNQKVTISATTINAQIIKPASTKFKQITPSISLQQLLLHHLLYQLNQQIYIPPYRILPHTKE